MEGFNVLATAFFLPLLFSSNLFHVVSTASDTLSPDQSLIDGKTLISSDGSFELGFFIPKGTNNSYLGIRIQNIPNTPVVWVANRKYPVTVAPGVLNLTTNGQLIVQDQAGKVFWSTNISGTTVNINPTAQLLDSGNLVIWNDSKSIVWQSFDYPSGTLLPGMKLGWDLRANLTRRLSSWTSNSDPSPGTYSLAMDLRGSPEMYTWWNGSKPCSRSGPLDGKSLSGVVPMRSDDFFTFRFVAKDDEVYYAYENSNHSIVSRLVVKGEGKVQLLLWLGNGWKTHWSGPRDQCDMYAKCGAHGVCNMSESPVCKCLTGFVPNKSVIWNSGVFSDGCIRSTPLDCQLGDSGEGFLKVTVKLPDTSKATVSSKNMFPNACLTWCLKNCSCMAFALLGGETGTCITWHGDLIDIREQRGLSLGGGDGDDLYVRLAASEPGIVRNISEQLYHQLDMPTSPSSPSGDNLSTGTIIIITATLIGSVVVLIVIAKITRCLQTSTMQHNNAPTQTTDSVMNSSLQTTSDTIEARPLNSTANGDRSIEAASIERFLDDFLKEKPMKFTPQDLIDFTHNYEEKLGAGGFGEVYKGCFPNGVLVAVKVLYRTLDKRAKEQFMAEVGTIGRTYHINLVRLYGFCFHATVKALVYEYMGHGSLDRYLFDKNIRLEWGKLHEIALGTAKGIRYLHEECQKKIIHYDIKPGNVLLGADFSPKVADFGLAKLCNREDSHVTLTGCRGTPGYAAPELWKPFPVTEKCDVYSFGMLLFEILGRRRKFDSKETESQEWFPQWVWEKYDQGELESIISLCGIEEKDREKAKRMCEVAMWCVQHHPESRPSMSSIVRMLEGEQEIIKPVNPFPYMVPCDAGLALSSKNTSDLTSRKSAENYTATACSTLI